MAQISSYPLGTPKTIDTLIGTEMPDPEGPVTNPVSKSYTVGSIVALATENALADGITTSLFVEYEGNKSEVTIKNGLIIGITPVV